MYYLIELNSPLYEVVKKSNDLEKLVKLLDNTKIISTTDFLETYFALIKNKDLAFYYYDWGPQHALSNKRATNDLTAMQHFIALFDKWDVCAKLRQVTKDYYKFTLGDGTELYTKFFKQGDPFKP